MSIQPSELADLKKTVENIENIVEALEERLKAIELSIQELKGQHKTITDNQQIIYSAIKGLEEEETKEPEPKKE